MPDRADVSRVGPQLDEEALSEADRDGIMGALFESFVTQQGSLGLSLMGELPGGDQGNSRPDLESAKLVIDQLEMFEFKSRGNLSPEEAAFLRKTLTVLGETLFRKLEQANGPSGPEGDSAGA